MSGSLSMFRPSRLRGSMRSSSSNGKHPSESKHSGTLESALLMSFDRLGLESSRDGQGRERKRWEEERDRQMMVGDECFFQFGKMVTLPLTVTAESPTCLGNRSQNLRENLTTHSSPYTIWGHSNNSPWHYQNSGNASKHSRDAGMLLSPNTVPVKHLLWCNHCGSKTMENTQSNYYWTFI